MNVALVADKSDSNMPGLRSWAHVLCGVTSVFGGAQQWDTCVQMTFETTFSRCFQFHLAKIGIHVTVTVHYKGAIKYCPTWVQNQIWAGSLHVAIKNQFSIFDVLCEKCVRNVHCHQAFSDGLFKGKGSRIRMTGWLALSPCSKEIVGSWAGGLHGVLLLSMGQWGFYPASTQSPKNMWLVRQIRKSKWSSCWSFCVALACNKLFPEESWESWEVVEPNSCKQ